MKGFTIPNKVDAIYPRQAQPHQVDMEILAEGARSNGVYKGCAIEIIEGMMIAFVELGDITDQSGSINVIHYNLELVDLDDIYREQVELATPQYVAITEGDATYDRFTLIWADYNGLHTTDGDPADPPIKPDLPQAEGDRSLGVVLYEVYVPATTTELLSDMITDKRVFVKRPREHYAWVSVSPEVTQFPRWD